MGVENYEKYECYGVFSDGLGKTTGGHFVEGVVGPTLEVMVLVGNEEVERVLDNGVGLNLLDI